MSKRRWLLVSLTIVVASLVYVTRVRSGMSDFAVNYQAGQRLTAGETLYQTGDGHYMFKYLPASALLYAPLAQLPLEAAKPLWFAIVLGAIVWGFALSRELVAPDASVALTVIPALVLAKYFLHELRLGQINAVVTVVMLLAARELSRPSGARSQLAAGALAGIATALKPYAALLFPYFIVTGRWWSAAAGAAVMGVALFVPTVFYGFEGNLAVLRQWADTLSASTPGLLTNADNVSVAAFFAKWRGDSTRALAAAAVVLGVLAVLALVVIVRGRRRPGGVVLEVGLLLTLIPLVSPLGWDYTFLMSVLAVTLLVHHFGRFPKAVRLALAVNFALIALAVYDVMGRSLYATFMQWSITTVNFIVIVVALATLRFRNLG